MIKINGEINSAIVYSDTLDNGSIGLIQALCNSSASLGSTIRIMPDVHSGKGCVIGTTMTIVDRVSPGLIGVDIGCGVTVAKITGKRIELQKLDKFIRENIPSGSHVRTKYHRYTDMIDLSELDCYRYIRKDKALAGIGTLGGGNHFIELDRSDDGDLYLIVHSGSRNLGYQVATLHNEKAFNNHMDDVPYELAYLQDDMLESYIHDIKFVQYYADTNRRAIIADIIKAMKWDIVDQFTTTHNYIDTSGDTYILRKGSISAKLGERVIIPLNMRDGCLLCTGKGNVDWNTSAPHGAGRLMDRQSVKSNFTLSQFKKEMAGIYSTSISKDTLDESPMAYKSMDSIINHIKDTVTIDEIIKPVYNFKAGDER